MNATPNDPDGTESAATTAPQLGEVAPADALLAAEEDKRDASITLAERYGAHNYRPLPVSLSRGAGAWVWDTEDRKYLDMLAAYSALNQGHRHQRIVKAAEEQLKRITITSRAFHNDQLGRFLRLLSEVTGFSRTLPMNTGAEAVETAIKAARKWGYTVKGVEDGKAEIIVCSGNFHGRTTTIVGFSSEEQYRHGFGPFTPGFIEVPYGDIDALRAAFTDHTVAFFVEPIQGEGGIVLPPPGYLEEARKLCDQHRALLVADEIQTGLGRTGALFACDHDNVRPDLLILGKALGGGVYPVSAVCGDDEVMGVFQPGDHGSTFGGNPLAAAVAMAALRVILDEDLVQRSRELGDWLLTELRSIESPAIREVRGRGLMIGVEIHKSHGAARPYCEDLMQRGILVKETHEQVIRLTPPLVVQKEDLEWALAEIRDVLHSPRPEWDQ